MSKRRRVCTGSEEGASAVEFALVLPILVALLVGVIQFGVIFFQWIELTHAAREGARWAALGYADGSVAASDTVRFKVYNAAPGLNPRLTDAQISIAPADHTIADYGSPVVVTVTYDAPVFTKSMSGLFGGSATLPLQSSAAQMIEGGE